MVVVDGPEGWYNTTYRDVPVVIDSHYGEVVDVEFGETRGASIRGKVYDDDNARALSNPKPSTLNPPRVFTNNATKPFYDLDPMMAHYDPWQKGSDGTFIEIQL